MPRHSSPKQIPQVTAQRAKPRQATTFDCEADILEGLERFGAAELSQQLNRYVDLTEQPAPGKLRFVYTGDLRALLDLRSVTAVYLVRRFLVPRPKALLGHQHFTALLDQIATARALFPSDAYQTLHLSAAGEDSAVMSRLKAELAQQTGLEIAAGEGDLLLRLRRAADRQGWEALVRLSPRPLATRAWRVCNRPGAPNATLAHAMMRLSAPQPDDAVVNLACGSGTLLVERLALGPVRSAIGCDIDRAALECARQNLRAAGVERLVRLEPWDATRLPLTDGSATLICADLPFGQLVGSHDDNELLYPQIFAEATRIAAPAARMVLLTHEVRLLERTAGHYTGAWRIEEVLRVRSGGMTPRVYLFRRL
jgi:ubiquinone/menaquinone biosynthesis C-methylase UbiE